MNFEPILYGPLFIRDAQDINLVAASADPVNLTVSVGGSSWTIPVTPVLTNNRYLAALRMREILSSVVGIPGLANAGEREVPLVTLSAGDATMSVRAVYGAASGKTPTQLAGHWLSWRDQVSTTHAWGRERLTFLAGLDLLGWQSGTYSVKAKIFLSSGDPVTVTLTSGTLQSGCRYVTVDASYATIAAAVSASVRSKIRAWDVSYSFSGTDSQSAAATINGYPLRLIIARDEVRVKEFVFCNSFGVEDRVYSSGRSNPKLDGSSVAFLSGATEYELRNDSTEGREVYSGRLGSARESALWLDFLKAHDRYILASGGLARITVDSQETDLQDNALGSVKFTYHLGALDNGRYFNDQEGLGDYDPTQRHGALYIGDEPPSEELPSEDLFFLKTRLDEFPAADLSEEYLFLVQDPLTLEWCNAPLSDIKEWLQQVIVHEDVHVWDGPWEDYSVGVAGYALAASLGKDLCDRIEALEGAPAYQLPIATATRLGGIKVGSGLSITQDGVLSADDVCYFEQDPDYSGEAHLKSAYAGLRIPGLRFGAGREAFDLEVRNVAAEGETPVYALYTPLPLVTNGIKIGGGDPILTWDSVNEAWHLSGNFYADGFVSAGGVSGTGGSAGIDPAAMWAYLKNTSSDHTYDADLIAAAHIPDMSSVYGYLKQTDIDPILAMIPAQASSTNQLADKAFVNSSIATATATYRGAYNEKSDLNLDPSATHAQVATKLGTVISGADANDYCFVEIPTSASTPTQIERTERYKYNGTGWEYEYTLNNSGFTAVQWAAINSNITADKVSAYDTVAGYFNDNGKIKQDNLPAMYIGRTAVTFSMANATLLGITAISNASSSGSSDQSRIVWDSSNSAWHFLGNVYADGFISAGGLSSGGGTTGIDALAMWRLLTNNQSLSSYDDNTKIAGAHIPDMASAYGYATQSWVATQGYLSSAVTSLGGKTGAVTLGGGLGIDSSKVLSNSGVRSVSVNGDSLRVNTGGTDADLTVPYATTTQGFKRIAGTAAAGGYDLNTLLSGGGVTSNYSSVYYWANGPANMSYGSVLQVNSRANNGLALQLAWDVVHVPASSTYGTGKLWWRDSTYHDSASDWGSWRLIYDDSTLTKSVLTNLLDDGAGTYVKRVGDSMSGDLTLANNVNINALDTASSARSLLYLSGANNVVVGGGTKDMATGGATYIDGKTIRLYTPNASSAWTTAMLVNGSQNVTIGASDLAAANYKLYVDGASYFAGAVTLPNAVAVNVKDSSAGVVEALLMSSADELRVGYGQRTAGITSMYGKTLRFATADTTAGPDIYIGGNSSSSHNKDAASVYFNSYVSQIRNGIKVSAEHVASADRLNLSVYTSNNATSPYAPSWNKTLEVTYDGKVNIGAPSTASATVNVNGTIWASTGIWSNGYVSGGGLSSSSDKRLKRGIKDFDYSAELLMALRPREWDWNELSALEGHAAGFIAQEVEPLLPYAVKERTYKQMVYETFHAVAFSALQDHETRIQDHETRILALERENRELKDEIKRLRAI